MDDFCSCILVLAFSGDIAAYYVGSRMGKTKLLPKVSPGKTVEGTIGLVVGSIAGALLFRQLFFPLLPVPHAVIMALVAPKWIIGLALGHCSPNALI